MRSIALMMSVVGLVIVFALAMTDVYIRYVVKHRCYCSACKIARRLTKSH